MFGRKNVEDRAYEAKRKQFGGCPPCDDCGGSGEVSETTGCEPCAATGIDIGPRGRARLQARKR